MDAAHVTRLAQCLERPEIRAHDPAPLAALARALGDVDPPVSVGRHGALVGYAPGPARRRLIELDRRGTLVAMLHWRDEGALGWARCRTAEGRWIGIEPDADDHPAWGRADRVWLLDETPGFAPVELLTRFKALDYERLDRIPPLAEPRRLGPGAGTAVLNLLAGLMKDQGAARVRYEGPYPTEQLFTALLESFRYDASVDAPLERFLAGEPLDWLPAPHERHAVADGVTAQMRHEVEKVVLRGIAFYRTRWQEVERREPRVLRADGERLVCSLWVLGGSLEDRLVLDRAGEVVAMPDAAVDPRAPAPFIPLWRRALAAVIARESAGALGAEIASVLGDLALEWGPVPGDLMVSGGAGVRLSGRLRDAGLDWILAAPPGAERAARAARFILEVARLLAPAIRLRAQVALEALPEEDQLARLQAADPPTDAALDESVGRLVALVARGHA
ncbi:MAG TPA: hypothetical protein VML54_13515 [Candidatus Limnocylindrales bacterium]|nr:hypothetical protein [Candidatus Limnocylindrales bacterium]